jgi:hypothetical protein
MKYEQTNGASWYNFYPYKHGTKCCVIDWEFSSLMKIDQSQVVRVEHRTQWIKILTQVLCELFSKYDIYHSD